jgi:hypothetical protein
LSNKLLLIGSACVVLGLFNAGRSWLTHDQEAAIERYGARAEGEVTRKWVSGDRDSGERHMVAYWFDVPGQARLEGEHRVAEPRYRTLRPGDRLTVVYSREDPRLNFPDGEGLTSRRSALIVVLLGVSIALFGVGLVVRGLRGAVS